MSFILFAIAIALICADCKIGALIYLLSGVVAACEMFLLEFSDEEKSKKFFKTY